MTLQNRINVCTFAYVVGSTFVMADVKYHYFGTNCCRLLNFQSCNSIYKLWHLAQKVQSC